MLVRHFLRSARTVIVITLVLLRNASSYLITTQKPRSLCIAQSFRKVFLIKSFSEHRRILSFLCCSTDIGSSRISYTDYAGTSLLSTLSRRGILREDKLGVGGWKGLRALPDGMDKFTYSSAPLKQIKGVQFGVLDPDLLVCMTSSKNLRTCLTWSYTCLRASSLQSTMIYLQPEQKLS